MVESLREDLLGALAAARFGLPPAPLDTLGTFPQWVKAPQRFEVPLG